MNENETHICTECLFIGEPHLSIGRLFTEFFANLLTGVSGAQLFQKVRHCPACGSHSMVLMSSEVGQNALAESKKGLIEKKLCDLCGGTLSAPDSSQDTQLCATCLKIVFEQQRLEK
jgi:hypothetical protein